MTEKSPFNNSGAEWLWIPEEKHLSNQYVQFRHEFILDGPADGKAKLFISADSDYAVWLNGELAGFGQYDDYPDDKVYDSLSVGSKLRPGRNILCVLVYYQGEGSSQYIKGDPGLIYSLSTKSANIVSGSEVYCRRSHTYKNGHIARITAQLGFTFEYDAGKYDNWLLKNYVMGKRWTRAKSGNPGEAGSRVILRPRPIKKLKIKERITARIAAQGVFTREAEGDKTAAELVQTDFLSARTTGEVFKGPFVPALPSDSGIRINPSCFESGRGVYLLIDLGREEAGILSLDLDTNAGAVIDIAHGEHLDDLRVRAAVGGRNFANRYICKEGRQQFTHYSNRLGCRYIELHIWDVRKRFILYYAGLKPAEYPVESRGGFNSPDNLQNRIYEVSVRTLHLCMHEHYEDCPWREQGLFSMDSRNQALCGYYCFGDYDFPAASFALLGHGLRDDNFLELCAPSNIHKAIPSFSMMWIVELAEHLLFSGNLKPAKSAMPNVRKMIDNYISDMKGGLFPSNQGEDYWHFYDWSDGLNGFSYAEWGPGKHVLKSVRFDAPLNLFFCMALDSASMLSMACGEDKTADRYKSHAEELRRKFHERFWDAKKSLYRTYYGRRCPGHYAELTQALAICAGIPAKKIASELRERLACQNNGMVPVTLSHSIFKFEALLQEPEKYAKIVFDKIAEDWGFMLFNGATSFWETIKGASDFDNAGSLCHGWSAIPVYFYQAYLLGIKPLEPGFKTFKVEPVRSVIRSASGRVPTPYGVISLDWKDSDGKLKYNLSINGINGGQTPIIRSTDSYLRNYLIFP